MSEPAAVLLRGKVFVSVLALKTLWALEDAGHEMTLVGKMFVINPTKAFTKEQSDHIAKLKPQLTRLVRYVLEAEYDR